jgi:hypothetical protein
MSSAGFGPDSDSKLYESITDPSSRQGGRPAACGPQMSDSNKNLAMGPKWGLDTKTDRLTVGRKRT